MTARAVARLLLLLAAIVAVTAVGQPPSGTISSSWIGSDISAVPAPGPAPLGLVPRASTGSNAAVMRTGPGAGDDSTPLPVPVCGPVPPVCLPANPVDGPLARAWPTEPAPWSAGRPADRFPTGPPPAVA